MDADKKDERSYRIIGAAIEVHRVLGPGFLESVYQQALAVEMEIRGIQHLREVPLPIFYKGHPLSAPFRADFICLDAIIVELKAKEKLTGNDEAQVINYLKGSRHEVGLLLNFGSVKLECRRLINRCEQKNPLEQTPL